MKLAKLLLLAILSSASLLLWAAPAAREVKLIIEISDQSPNIRAIVRRIEPSPADLDVEWQQVIHRFISRFRLASEKPVNYIAVHTEPAVSSTAPILVAIPTQVPMGMPPVYFENPAKDFDEFSERVIRTQIWERLNPRDSTPYRELYNGLHLTAHALKWLGAPERRRPEPRHEARVAYIHARIVNILRRQYRVDTDRDYEFARQRTLSALSRVLQRRENLAVLAIRQDEDGERELRSLISEFEFGRERLALIMYADIVHNDCSKDKVSQLRSILNFVLDHHNSSASQSMPHGWTLASDIAQCSVYLATCDENQDAAIARQLLTDAQKDAQRVQNEIFSGPSGLAINATLANLNEKLGGLESGVRLCTP